MRKRHTNTNTKQALSIVPVDQTSSSKVLVCIAYAYHVLKMDDNLMEHCFVDVKNSQLVSPLLERHAHDALLMKANLLTGNSLKPGARSMQTKLWLKIKEGGGVWFLWQEGIVAHEVVKDDLKDELVTEVCCCYHHRTCGRFTVRYSKSAEPIVDEIQLREWSCGRTNGGHL